MTIGLRIKIDVTKIRKELLYEGKKGTYLDATVFVHDEPDKYGQHGGITQDTPKRDDEKIYIGNVKKFWSDEEKKPPVHDQGGAVEDDDIPF